MSEMMWNGKQEGGEGVLLSALTWYSLLEEVGTGIKAANIDVCPRWEKMCIKGQSANPRLSVVIFSYVATPTP